MKFRRRFTGIYRSRHGLFMGVCQGLAEAFNWSPWAVRLVFLLLQVTLFHWIFLVYLLLGLLWKTDPVERIGRPYARFDRYERYFRY